MNLLQEIKQRLAPSLSRMSSDAGSLLEMIRPAQDSQFGDYQANCAMSLGKQLGRPPRDVAGQLVAEVDWSDLCHPPEVAGPGFINLRLRDELLFQQLDVCHRDARLGVPFASPSKTFVVDYSAPNVAKSMHVGHIRSTVIGDALCRILRFLGHQVVSDNHLGDWGTQFGMIIYGYRNFLDSAAYQAQPVDELGRLYRVVRQLMDYYDHQRELPRLKQRIEQLQVDLRQAEQLQSDPAQAKQAAKQVKRLGAQIAESRGELSRVEQSLRETEADPVRAERARQHADIHAAVLHETAKLHAGDPDNLALWREILPKCLTEIQRIYDRLDVKFDEVLGESFYHDQLADVVEDFQKRGLARISDGAMCVFLDGFDAPMIIRKQDGAFLYATTDLATIRYRIQRWNPAAILYVVDFRQGEHFQKLFAAARLWGYDQIELQHVAFGTVLGDDGKPFKTRAGDTVGLEGLLDAAVAKARQVVAENDDAKRNGRELSDDQRDHIAQVVGHAAIKYADLSQNRTSDYVYSEDKMVALKGNTATYLQYSAARIAQIFARGDIDLRAHREVTIAWQFAAPAERQLALTLLRFSEALDEILADYRPNLLTNYLYQLATQFSEFYEACPVLKAESAELRDQRLRLCDLTGRVLRQGLSLLGIETVDKM